MHNKNTYMVSVYYEEAINHCYMPEIEVYDNIIHIKTYKYQPNNDEICQFNENKQVQIKIWGMDEILIPIFKMGDADWNYGYYNIMESQYKPDTNDDKYMMYLHLYDTDTGKLCAMKKVCVPNDLGVFINAHLRWQMEHPISKEEYEYGVKTIRRCCNMDDLLRKSVRTYIL